MSHAERTDVMDNLPIATQFAVSGLGIGYCLYSIVFRWTAIRNKYGRFGLYWWLLAVLSVSSVTAYFAGVAVWLIQQELSS